MSPTSPGSGGVMVLIPAFNEAESIGRVVAGSLDWKLPVVVVDDGSSDSTAEEAERAGAHVVGHPANMGKGKALATGFGYAEQCGYDAVITLDGDGQHDPGQIGRFLEEFGRGEADVIVGSRMANIKCMPRIRRLTNRVSSFVVSRIAGIRITDSQSGYRLVTTRAWRMVNPYRERFDTEPELIFGAARLSLSIKEVPITTIYENEVSKISPVRDTWRFIKVSFGALAARMRWGKAAANENHVLGKER